MSYGVGRGHGLDPVLLWLWHRPAATAPTRPLAWERPCAASTAPKRPKQKQKQKQKNKKAVSKLINRPLCCKYMWRARCLGEAGPSEVNG